MLTYLGIKNFALISSLAMEPGPGLTVLSGETGAGKSIILAAVNMLIGQRADSELIRAGADQAVLEAQFDLEAASDPAHRLDDEGMAGEEGELVVRRLVNREGRNRVQVNGNLATLGLLAELGPELVSIVGQHASQALLKPEEQLWLLDAFGGLEDQVAGVGRAVAKVREMDREVARSEEALARREERREELEQLVADLEAVNLDPAEETELKAERQLLANSEEVAALASQAHQGLYADDGSALEVLDRLRGLVEELARLDPRTAQASERLSEAFFLVEDVAHQVRDYEASLSFDPHRLDWVEQRLHEIRRITRRHGGNAAGALEVLAGAKEELAGLDSGEEKLNQLRARRQEALDQAVALASKLGKARRATARKLAEAAEAELSELGLDACRLRLDFASPAGGLDTPQGPLGPRGLEAAEIMIAPNPGEGFRPLRRIASGGELSRMLLALRTLVARRHGAPTLIFDEVDAGIGGATGAAVGKKLARLATRGQVICITHLPQIAAWADVHYAVEKQVEDGRTATRLALLDEAGRSEEMGRMLAGVGTGEAAREHALEMLEAARQAKQKL
ncbi:MAG: DNA repair protein RecN [Desulfarculaceae bacterium]|nr:DNA repair protein RecN [Desulfarculaceae bacterium]MCF8073323.1 DNA repair protein RecN [Desulfarculaceae bacterium]MCF8103241.1 DNA repair protein RecN [Desulfarculaceae bacterium]MCF8116625.1 DNA repair protein RecN [Desulfarculaceae bacterium]